MVEHCEAHGEEEGGAGAQLAGHPEAAAHLGHYAAANAQAQPRAACAKTRTRAQTEGTSTTQQLLSRTFRMIRSPSSLWVKVTTRVLRSTSGSTADNGFCNVSSLGNHRRCSKSRQVSP